MDNENNNLVSCQTKNTNLNKNENYTIQDALGEFEELKNIALNCFDKNGNPNLSMAIRAVENKAKIAGLYSKKNAEILNVVNMGEIVVDGEQLKLKIGDDF